MSKRIYISGSVSGLDYVNVVRKFRRAADQLKRKGYDVINPLNHVSVDSCNKSAMKSLLPLLLNSDAIYMLSDWEFSQGAKIELMLAQYAGLDIEFED